MANTGRKIYTELEQYFLSTGSATGLRKANVSGDPDYLPPVVDTSMCPLGVVYTASRSAVFFKQTCGAGYTGEPVTYFKSYQSEISQSDADSMASSDPNFNAEGQLYADNNGSCVADDIPVLMSYLTLYRTAGACVEGGQLSTAVFMSQDTFLELNTVTESASDTGIYLYRDLHGTIPVLQGWYFALHSGKSFYADNTGQVTHFSPCTLAPPVLTVGIMEMMGVGYILRANLIEPYHVDVVITGRIDSNPVMSSENGVDFTLTILEGETSATLDPLPLVKVPGLTYYWFYVNASPGSFIINKQTPI